jgi:hypothetical protein
MAHGLPSCKGRHGQLFLIAERLRTAVLAKLLRPEQHMWGKPNRSIIPSASNGNLP